MAPFAKSFTFQGQTFSELENGKQHFHSVLFPRDDFCPSEQKFLFLSFFSFLFCTCFQFVHS